MIIYTAYDGTERALDDVYQIDIAADIEQLGKKAVAGFRGGWFAAKAPDPAACFYMLNAASVGYFANKATAVKLIYYLEVRSKNQKDKEKAAQKLCSAMAKLYDARRGQYSDSFETATGTYVKRITFTFTVKIRS